MESACRYFLAVIVFAIAPSAFAAELPKEGSFDYTACWSGTSSTIAFSKTHTARSFEQTGSIRSNPPGGLFDKDAFRCIGMSASFAGKNTGTSVCESIDLLMFGASGGHLLKGETIVELLGVFSTGVLSDDGRVLSPAGPPTTVLFRALQSGLAHIEMIRGDPWQTLPQRQQIAIVVAT